MDLRKGSEVKAGKRRCFRCSGRKKMYQVGKSGVWTHDNSGGVLKDCPLCLGKGVIDRPEGLEIICGADLTLKSEKTKLRLEKEDAKKRRKPGKAKENVQTEFDKEY